MPSSGKVKTMQSLSNEESQKKVQLKKKKEKMKINSAELKFSSVFGVDDELNLQLQADESPTPVSVQLPENQQVMKDQIRGLKDENGRLFQLLKEKDFEIRHLQKFKSEHAVSLGMPGLTSDTAAAKIVELSKKLRETVAEMETEKTKCKQLAKKCEDLKLQIANPKECHSERPIEQNTNSEEQKSAEEVKGLQEKLKQAESKMADWRNQCQILKQELKLANRVISQEVGEGFNLHSLISGKSTWKGRTQQIITLQQKISELKHQIEDLQSRNENSPKEAAASEKSNSNPTLRRLVQERKEAHDKVIIQLKEVQEQHASLKSKFESGKARNQVLSNEVKILKQQIQTLLDKGQHDDEMISTLMMQLSHMKDLMQENNQLKQQHQEMKLPKMSATKLNDDYIVEQLNRIIAERDEKIRSLTESLKHLSGEMTPKGEAFYLAPVADPNTEKNNCETAMIQEYIFNSNELPAAEEKINVIQQEHDHLRRSRLVEKEISKGEDALKDNEIKAPEKYQVNFGGRKDILSLDNNLIDEDELKTVLEIEEDKKEAMNAK